MLKSFALTLLAMNVSAVQLNAQMTDPDAQIFVFNTMKNCAFETDMKMNDLGIKKGDQNVTVGDFSKNKVVRSLAQLQSATKVRDDATVARGEL